MSHLTLMPAGPLRWWGVPLAFLGSLFVLLGISQMSMAGEFGQMAIFLAYVLIASIIAVLVAGRAAAGAIGVRVPERRGKVLSVAVIGAALIWLLAAVGERVNSDVAQSTKQFLDSVSMGSSDGRDFWVIVTICCLAPIGEEALYRAMIFKGVYDPLRRMAGIWGRPWIAFLIAAAFASLVFALSHGGEGQEASVVIVIGLSGIVFALCYAVTGSLWTAVMAHSFNNTISLGVAVFAVDEVSSVNKMAIVVMPLLTWGLMWIWAALMPGRGRAA